LLGEQDQGWLEAIASASQRKYAAGQANLVEVSLAENERAKRGTQLVTDRANLEHERVALNRMLARDLHAGWPVLVLPAPANEIVYNERLVALALRYEPKMKVLREEIARGEAAAEVTRRQRFPDLSVGLEGRNYSGDGSFRQGAVVLNMGLPWLNANKYRSDIKREEARVKASELDLRDYELAVREDVHHLAVEIDAARREALVYRDEIIPRSEVALESARAGWETGRNSFRDLLDARRMWLEGKLMYARAVAQQYETMSELVLCCGLGDLGALQMLGALPREAK